MTPKLTTEQDEAIRAHGSPCPVIGADNQTQYVIISTEQFELYRQLFEQGPFSQGEQLSALQHNAAKAGWDDPEMDAYDDYDQHRPST